jgi:vancomycin resistance protein YoaR
VVGGGVAQVASAIWLAVKDLDEVTILEKSTYGDKYNQSYVDDPDDAILTDYTAGTDFSFRNDSDSQITINTSVTDDELSCQIYEN